MKKILSISLALVMLVCLCMSMVSCEQDTAFSKYYSYLEGLESKTDMVQADGITMVVAQATTMGEEETPTIMVMSSIKASDATISAALFLKDNTSTYDFVYSATSSTTNTNLLTAKGSVDALSFTGNELVAFDTYQDNTYNSNYYETSNRGTATAMLKTLVLSMKPMMAKADVNVEDFYFISVDFPESDNTATDTNDDLGGAFSVARWSYVGQMLVVGLGMVFLVLAILWIVLIIFEKVMGTKSAPEKKVDPTPTQPVTPPQPATPVAPQNDDAVVAAITAAIATMIASDEQLSSEFAGGFRVVSFRRKGRRGSWND